jgi:hypothetical protein
MLKSVANNITKSDSCQYVIGCFRSKWFPVALDLRCRVRSCLAVLYFVASQSVAGASGLSSSRRSSSMKSGRPNAVNSRRTFSVLMAGQGGDVLDKVGM